MHYYLISLSILAEQLASDPNGFEVFLEETGTKEFQVEDILEKYALDICGSAFTLNTPTVLVNAFGPISYCKSVINPDIISEVRTDVCASCPSYQE